MKKFDVLKCHDRLPIVTPPVSQQAHEINVFLLGRWGSGLDAGSHIAMSPGMTVTAEIKTSTRRILEYLFSPLVETSSEAMRER
jgi:hypothetical protein